MTPAGNNALDQDENFFREAGGSAEFAGIARIRRPSMVRRPVRLTVCISHIADPILVKVPDGDGGFYDTIATELVLRDVAGDEIETVEIRGEALVDKVQALRRRGGYADFLGWAVTVGGDEARQRFFFEVQDAAPSSSALDMIGASGPERVRTQELLRVLEGRGQSPLEYVLEELERELHIAALDEFPLLRTLLRFAVLQSMSVGRLGHASGRLHGLVIGPPATGKKLIGLAARVCNPRTEEASAAKISPAGLVGASHRQRGGWGSQPGLIPQADGGVLVLQDAHAISRSELRRLGPVLQELCEDGVVRDSVAGGIRREANVSLLVDLNRMAQAMRAAKAGTEAALLALRPLLSRLDLIAEIPEDARRAWKVASEMYAIIGPGGSALDDMPWVRRVRLLVAALRDRHPEIDLDPMRTVMRSAHELIAAENDLAFEGLPDAGDIPARLTISFARFVSASARGHDRSEVTQADVDEALTYIRLKLGFLRLLVPRILAAEAAATPSAGYDAARQRYAGQTVRTVDFAAAVEDATGETVSERTARRHLRALGAKRQGRGVYSLPPAEKEGGGSSEKPDGQRST